MRSVSVVLFLLTAFAATADAQWSNTPWSGIRAIERTDPGPVRIRAFEVDLCSPGMTVRATRPAEANQVVSSWASSVDVQVAVNANMWHCGALCGVGIGNGESFGAPDDNHWGYLAFMPEHVDYPWDYDTIPPAPWIEQAVGGHPRLVNAGAPIPEFAGNCLERHPRTSGGFNADRTKLILAVADGRSSSSIGMTCASMANLMVSLGAHEAINLDGGGSSTAWRADRGVLNVPSDGRQRTVRNHLGARSYGEGVPRYCSTHRALTAEEGVLRPLSQPVSEAFGFSLLDLRLWSGEAIAGYDVGSPVEMPRLIRATGEPAVYLVDGGFRRHVINPRSLLGFHLHDNPIEELSVAEVEAYPMGPPLTQYPYIAVGPAPDHDAYLVDVPLPPLPMPDAGPTDLDAGADDAGSDPDAGRDEDAGMLDAGPGTDGGADAGSSSLTGGCSASHADAFGLSFLMLAIALSRRRIL